MNRDRRHLLSAALTTTAGVALYGSSLRRARSRDVSATLVTTPLAANLALIAGAGANVVAARSPDGTVLVDGGLAENSGALIHAALKATSGKRIVRLVNTHWHPEQTGSNERLGYGGTKIIGHVNTQLWLNRKIFVDWRPTAYGPLPARALPSETFYKSTKMMAGDEAVELGYLAQAHTDGDIYVFFRNSNVLVGGGVVSQDRWPIVDFQTGGWIAGLVAGLDSLIAISDDATRIVPANGALLTRTDLKNQRIMYFTIYDRLVKALTQGLGPDEVLASQPAEEFNPQWGDSKPFITKSFKSLWGHFAADA